MLAGIDPRLALYLTLGIAVLCGHRYLADSSIVAAPSQRWLLLAAWLIGTAVAVGLRRGGGRRAATLVSSLLAGPLLGAGALAIGWSVEPLGASVGDLTTALIMLTLLWLPVALAIWGLPHLAARPRSAWLPAAYAAVGCVSALLVVIPGPIADYLRDPRHDKLTWLTLAVGWLILAPRLVTSAVLDRSAHGDGWGLGRWRWWLPWTFVLWVGMALLIGGYAARQPGFTSYYPMFKGDWYDWTLATNGAGFLLLFELCYAMYFLAWEAFFRGWLLFGTGSVVGPNAILITTLPFVLMHIGKPGPEFASSLIAGLALGWLAWRAQSFWPCWLLHAGAALAMDLVAVLHSP